jgi:hypothetical protein
MNDDVARLVAFVLTSIIAAYFIAACVRTCLAYRSLVERLAMEVAVLRDDLQKVAIIHDSRIENLTDRLRDYPPSCVSVTTVTHDAERIVIHDYTNESMPCPGSPPCGETPVPSAPLDPTTDAAIDAWLATPDTDLRTIDEFVAEPQRRR